VTCVVTCVVTCSRSRSRDGDVDGNETVDNDGRNPFKLYTLCDGHERMFGRRDNTVHQVI
jgi:hypothetical protein